MAQPLVPAPADLGLASPALGPWFDEAALTLGAPGGDLSVTVSPTAAAKWLPPARGILSLYFATPTRPAALARLRAANGQKAFTDNRFVGLFWLLPEIEARLEALARNLPSPDGNAATAPTRPVPRWFALESTSVTTASTVAAVLDLTVAHVSSGDPDAEKLASLGLGGSGSALGNGEKAATILLGPEHLGGSGDSLLQLDTGAFRLWAFDARGRAIDPGAVAAWWARLATTTFDNLWAGSGADQRTCPVAAARTLHLVGAHEGPVPAALLARTNVGGTTGAATDNVRSASGTAAVTIGFTAAPASDDAPLPRAALLPHGAYGASLSLWPSGPVATDLARDYARVAVVDVESHLTGQARAATSATPTEGDTRRARRARRPGGAAASRRHRRRGGRADCAGRKCPAGYFGHAATRPGLWPLAASCGRRRRSSQPAPDPGRAGADRWRHGERRDRHRPEGADRIRAGPGPGRCAAAALAQCGRPRQWPAQCAEWRRGESAR